MRSLPGLSLALLCGLSGIVPLSAESPSVRLEAFYHDLLEQEFSSEALEIPPEGVTWAIDTTLWHLESGFVRLLRPGPDNRATGLMFEGVGFLSIEVPDPVELRQLRRFTKTSDLENLTARFDFMLVHTIGELPELLQSIPKNDAYSPSGLAKDRLDHAFRMHRDDVAARQIASLARPDDLYYRAEMRTKSYGWLTYSYDDERLEEIQLDFYNSQYSYVETWLSLDRPEDRAEDGRPGFEFRPRIDVVEVEIDADLTNIAKQGTYGESRVRPLKALIQATVKLTPNYAGDRALRFSLTPMAKVLGVRDDKKQELVYLRDHLGQRSTAIDNDVYDDSLIVLLDEPVAAGKPIVLQFEYEMRVFGFAPGRGWYPSTEPEGTALFDRHTGRMAFTTRDEYAVRAMGRLELDDDQGSTRRTVWIQEEPLKMMSFVVAKQHHEATLEIEDLPEIAVFGSVRGYLSPKDLELIGADVVNSLNFFQQMFDSELGTDRLQIGTIPASHGQAFEGLLHIGDFTTATDNVARVEMFRAHEVAHQWWGHKVGWQSYRDQWLSEGMAQYSAMMFVEQTVKGGKRYFRQMLQAYSDEITGSLGSSGSQFARPGVTRLNRRGMDRMGPIGHGYRSSVGETPSAYSSQAYLKGSLVMHMLRVLTRVMTGSDEAFVDVLRLYVDRRAGDYASTEDLQAALTERVPADWDWFFDQWIFGAEIPTYVWSRDTTERDGNLILVLDVEQRGVAPDFKMPVPVLIEYPGGDTTTVLAVVDSATNRFEFELEATPKKVIFNPDHAVLARTKSK